MIISINVIFHRPSELFDNVEGALLKNCQSKNIHKYEPSHASYVEISTLTALTAPIKAGRFFQSIIHNVGAWL